MPSHRPPAAPREGPVVPSSAVGGAVGCGALHAETRVHGAWRPLNLRPPTICSAIAHCRRPEQPSTWFRSSSSPRVWLWRGSLRSHPTPREFHPPLAPPLEAHQSRVHRSPPSVPSRPPPPPRVATFERRAGCIPRRPCSARPERHWFPPGCSTRPQGPSRSPRGLRERDDRDRPRRRSSNHPARPPPSRLEITAAPPQGLLPCCSLLCQAATLVGARKRRSFSADQRSRTSRR